LRSVSHVLAVLHKHRELAWELTKREVKDRYAGHAFGVLWAIGHPVLFMGVYLFVFAVVFRVRMADTFSVPRDYPVYLLSGLIPWIGFCEAMSRSSTSILSNVSLVKQAIFPLAILPVKAVLASLLTQFLSLAILLIYILARGLELPWTFVLLPILFFLQFLAMVGVAFVLSGLGTYFRDLREFVQVWSFAGVYLMPAVYLPEWVPSAFQPILYANPFSYLIWCHQDVLYYGRIAHPEAWVILTLLAFLTFAVGCMLFRKLELMFGNVL